MTGRGSRLKLLSVALVASLALNVFFVARDLTTESPGGWRERAQGSWILRLAEGLPEDDQATVAAILARHQPAMNEDFDAMIAATSGVMQALATDPFDEEQAQAAMAVVRDRQDELHLELHETLMDVGRELSAESRKTLADTQTRWRQSSD